MALLDVHWDVSSVSLSSLRDVTLTHEDIPEYKVYALEKLGIVSHLLDRPNEETEGY